MFYQFFLKNFGGHESFLWGHWYPILDFWWCLLWVSKQEWVLHYLSLVEVYMLCYTFPEIRLWCDTCWPVGGQHGSQAISSTYLQGIGGTWNQELSCRRSQCEIRQARCSTDWAIPSRQHGQYYCSTPVVFSRSSFAFLVNFNSADAIFNSNDVFKNNLRYA